MNAPELRPVYLIGLMGAGKSTVGQIVADRLGVEYLDNDAVIADLAGESTVVLAGRGGGVLHGWEERYVGALVSREDRVVAGIPASSADRPQDLARLRSRGTLVYLFCEQEELARRIAAGPARPWIVGDPAELVERMWTARDPVLRSGSDAVVDVTASPPRACADAVIDAVDG